MYLVKNAISEVVRSNTLMRDKTVTFQVVCTTDELDSKQNTCFVLAVEMIYDS